VVLDILLPLGEAALVDRFVRLFPFGEVALHVETLRVMLGGLLPRGKRPLMRVLVLLRCDVVRCGDGFRLLALLGGPPL
jgi:hypothetical protein